jgi:hypothetical protein
MTRIHHARPQHAAPRSNLLERPRAVVKKPKPYKVVLEVVTQEKKKLHSIVRRRNSFHGALINMPLAHLRI